MIEHPLPDPPASLSGLGVDPAKDQDMADKSPVVPSRISRCGHDFTVLLWFNPGNTA